MKTYLLNIPKELKKFSQELDAKALLCNKTWEVLNDEGNKQVFIFQNDGKLLISTNGDVTNSTWQFITANYSIVITVKDQTTMLRPAFIDGVIFAMQKDGTQECLFLIDEHNKSICPNRTLTELKLYFHKEVEKILEAEAKQREQPQREQERKKREEEQKKKEEEQIKREQERLKNIAIEHRDEINALVERKKRKLLIFIAITTAVVINSVILTIEFIDNVSMLFTFLFVGLLAFMIDFCLITVTFFTSTLKNSAEFEIVEKYRKQ